MGALALGRGDYSSQELREKFDDGVMVESYSFTLLTMLVLIPVNSPP